MRIRELIKALGGPREVAAKLDLRISAVSNWSARNNIPAEYHLVIWRMAIARKVSWRPPNSEGFAPPSIADKASAPASPPADAPRRSRERAA